MSKVILACLIVAFFIGLLALLASCASHAPDEDMSHKDAQGVTQWLQQHQ